MNDLKGDGAPFYYAVYKISDKTLQTCFRKGDGDGITIDNSQNVHINNPDGSVTYVYNSIVRGTRQQLLDTFETYGIINPDNIEIPE